MHAVVTHVDLDRMIVRIRANAGPLRSRLTCQVTPINERQCTITRIQAYPGLVGRLLTLVKGRREAKEAADYLEAWAAHARTLSGDRG